VPGRCPGGLPRLFLSSTEWFDRLRVTLACPFGFGAGFQTQTCRSRTPELACLEPQFFFEFFLTWTPRACAAPCRWFPLLVRELSGSTGQSLCLPFSSGIPRSAGEGGIPPTSDRGPFSLFILLSLVITCIPAMRLSPCRDMMEGSFPRCHASTPPGAEDFGRYDH